MNFEEANDSIPWTCYQYRKDPPSSQSLIAVEALGEMNDPRAVKHLAKIICSQDGYDDELRVKAIDSLAKQKHTFPVESIIMALRDHLGAYKPLDACVLTPSFDAPAILGILLMPLDGMRWDIQQVLARWALEKLKSQRAISAIITALQIENVPVRGAAAEALGELKETSAVEPLLSTLDSCMQTGNPAANHLCTALGKMKDPRAVPLLIKALRFKDKNVNGGSTDLVRRSAISALLELQDPRAVDPLIEVLLPGSGNGSRAVVVAVEALTKFENVKAIPTLLQLTNGRGPEESAAAEKALKELCGRHGIAAIEMLAKGLQDTSFHVRSAAAACLGGINNPLVHAPLLNALKDGNMYVRSAAVESVNNFKDPRFLDPLITALKDPEQLVRNPATHALSAFQDQRAIDALYAALDMNDGGTDFSAARALVRLDVNDPKIAGKILNLSLVSDFNECKWAINKLSKAKAADFLAAGLFIHTPGVRQATLDELAKLKDARSLVGIHKYLSKLDATKVHDGETNGVSHTINIICERDFDYLSEKELHELTMLDDVTWAFSLGEARISFWDARHKAEIELTRRGVGLVRVGKASADVGKEVNPSKKWWQLWK